MEIVRGFFEQWGSVPWRDQMAEDVVWDISASPLPNAGVYRGHAGVEKFFSSWLGAWEDPSPDLLELIDAGDSVFSAFRWRGRGRTSGAEVKRDFFGVYEFRDGLLIRYSQIETREEALAAAGLSE